MKLNFQKLDGLIPAIAQDYKTGEVLMVAFMNKKALEKTLKTKKAHYFSRSKNKLWLKGETSGNYQLVREILVDCDNDSIVMKVRQLGGACHNGYKSCFYRKLKNKKLQIVKKRIFNPKEVYKNGK